MCSPARDMTAEYHAVSTVARSLISASSIESHSVGSLDGRRPDVSPHLFPSQVVSADSVSLHRGKVIAETEHDEDIVYARIGAHVFGICSRFMLTHSEPQTLRRSKRRAQAFQ